uniref:alpha-L-fucosidase n=1 Tax=Hirondellea gigas TaxID=1518452 RepID=A0A6A7G4B0_9CRUS
MDLGPNRDLVGELADAIRKKTPHIHFGLYHSMFEWFNPFYIADKANNYQTNDFVERKTFPELLDIVNTYKPDVIYSDGEWEAPDWYWNSTLFLAWLFNDSPVKDTIVVNDRWGADTRGKHGSYYTHDDKFNPGVVQDHKWEGGLTLDKYSWGYRRNAVFADFLTPHEVITRLVTVVSCGGNFLVNIGPTHDGMLPPLMEERLRQMGKWLALNGEAIYSSTPWTVQNDTLTPGVWFTNVGDTVYGMVLLWPESGSVTLASVESTADTVVTMLGDSTGQPLETQQGEKGLEVTFPSQAAVISQWVWVLKMTGVNPAQRRHLKTRIPY